MQLGDSPREACRSTVTSTPGNLTSLKCFYTNANSLINKIDELRMRVVGCDVIGITETSAHEDIRDAELQVAGFRMYRKDRKNTKGGGASCCMPRTHCR